MNEKVFFMKSYCTIKKVYDEDLWICLYDRDNDKIIATGIAECDAYAKEGSLDWIQVSNECRNIGFGSIIVKELLKRLKNECKFVTVSCKVENKNIVELLYESCGFSHKVY